MVVPLEIKNSITLINMYPKEFREGSDGEICTPCSL